MKKKCNVVMLPTEKERSIKRRTSNGKHHPDYPSGYLWYEKDWGDYGFDVDPNKLWEGQHLYITSDDEIKEGDYFLTGTNTLALAVKETFGNGYDAVFAKLHWKKIIATTDSSLTVPTNIEERRDVLYNNSLPQIPESFINKFVEEYNKGNVIEEVMVDYNTRTYQDWVEGDMDEKEYYKLKVNQDNTISISTVKDSWSREEVFALCKSAFNMGSIWTQNISEKHGANPKFSFEKWAKENL